MHISQKRSCERCRGLVDGQGSPLNCEFGYKNQEPYHLVFPKIYPREPCPKPLTISEYFDACNNYRKSQK